MSQPQSFFTSHGEELTAALVEKIDQRRQLDAQILELLARMDREHVASTAGYPSLAAYVSHATRMAKHVASRLIGYAKTIGETPTPTGHVNAGAVAESPGTGARRRGRRGTHQCDHRRHQGAARLHPR